MKYKISDFKVSATDTRTLEHLFLKRYRIKAEELISLDIIKKSIDARKKDDVMVSYVLLADLKNKVDNRFFVPFTFDKPVMTYPKYNKKYPPVIVGFGPSGMFAALYLARCNAKPIIIERGGTVSERKEALDLFYKEKVFNPNCNCLYGEGGAGTFSDGKLTTNVKDPLISYIINEFYTHGAKEEILYKSKPHIGTDYLEEIVKNIREEIRSLGGVFMFHHTFLNYQKVDDYLEISVMEKEREFKIKGSHLILGIGHSARDTYKMLFDKKTPMEPKAFSMGVRIEHLAKNINKAQYGDFYESLEPADYKLAVHFPERNCYTFCMCPGGYVMATQDKEDLICTNGMSYNKRDGVNSNSALLVDVKVEDYYKTSVLDGMYFQEKYEHLAYLVSKDYKAPGNLVKEFLENKIATDFRSVKPTYPFGITFTDLRNCLPNFVVNTLKKSIPLMGNKIKGFDSPDAILTGIESRSSSPLRILRDENYKINNEPVYPVGEGAGYAGGITSSALDGLKCAMAIMKE